MVIKKAGYLRRFRGFRRDAKMLVSASLIQHLGFALNGFVLVLYLDVLGHSPVLFGTLGLLMELSHVAVLLGSGYLADRYGRKRMLLLGAILGTIGIMIFAFFESIPMFFLASVFLGASSGFWGPAFSALLSEKTTTKRRSYLFSLNSMVGLMGSGAITLIGGFVPLLFIDHLGFGNEAAYRMIYMLALMLNIGGLLLVLKLRTDRPRRAKRDAETSQKKPWPLIFKFSLPMAFTGLGAGMLVPYFPIYFKYRFELELESIGIIFALLSFVMAMMTVYLPRLAEKRGTVLTTTLFHFSAIFAMISMPFTPWLSVVVLLFVFRAAMMNVPGPIMTSFMMSSMSSSVRATAQSSTAFAWMVTHAAGMFIGGFLWVEGSDLALPFYLSTGLYALSTVLYVIFFIGKDDKKHGQLVFRPRHQQK